MTISKSCRRLLIALPFALIMILGHWPPETVARGAPSLAPSLDSTSVRFAVIGDYGLAGTAEADVANQVKSWSPDFIVTVGDNNYEGGAATTIDANIGQYYHDFIAPYAGGYGAGAASNAFFPALGNHDWVTPNAQPYLDYFALPGNERYYDFVRGPVHFFMLDSDTHEPDGYAAASTQAAWLQAALAASTSRWNLVLLHHAPYSSGTHGPTTASQWPYQAWGADAVLAGHDHTYERIMHDGIPYFVNGLGGRSIYGFGTPVPGSQVRYNGDYGAMRVEATSSTITFAFISRTGTVQDTYQLPAVGTPTIFGCPMYPANNIWNAPVDNLPLDSHSSAWVNAVGADTGLHMDFGSGTWDGGPIGIPFNSADSVTPKYAVDFYYGDESDPGPYPIPNNPLIEYGSDHHLLVVDQSTCTLYEMYDVSHNTDGSWSGGSGAIWSLNSHALRPSGWTSADAAGLPILPGLVRYDEVEAGEVNHAIRFTTDATNSYIWPARHLTSGSPGVLTSTPPMGARFRLKASFDVSGYPAPMQVILRAMKKYGIILADNGSDWFITGAPDPHWDNDMLHLLDDITGSNFEAVNVSGLMVNADSGATNLGAAVDVTIAGSLEGTYPLAPGQATLDSYPGVNAGPVLVEATDGKHIVASIRANWILNGQYRSYSEMMGMPAEQLSTEYWMPWYNFAVPSLLDEQLRIGNADTTATSAQVAIGTTLYGPYDLNPGQSMRLSYPGVNNGPIRVWSLDNKKITAAMRAVWLLNGNWTSYSELMGLPVEKLATEYWMPWYDFASPSSLDEQIRVGNADTTATSVQISIGSTVYGPYPFNPGQSTRLSFPGVSGGPVRIWSTDGKKITAAMREVWLSNGNWTSYSEMMGLPTAQLSTDYWMPWYSFANSSSLDEQLRFGNVDTTATSVQVSIGGTVHGPYALNPGTSTLQSYLGVQNGPVRIWSVDGKKIVASMRAIWPNASQGTSYSEMMGLPAEQLSDSYWFPWYNFAVPTLLDEQLRFALP